MSSNKSILAATSITAIILLAPNASAQSCGLHETFENYPPGPLADGQGGWSVIGRAVIDDELSSSGHNSLRLGSDAEVLHPLDIADGIWELSVMTYMPSFNHIDNAYIIGYAIYEGPGGEVFYSMQVRFGAMDGLVESQFDFNVLPLIRDQWIELRAVVNLNENRYDLLYGDQVLVENLVWHGEIFNSPTWQAINLFSYGLEVFYADDIIIAERGRCPADFNRDGVASTLDFLAFLNAYNAQDPCADRDHNGIVNTLDFLSFLNDYNAGCP